MLIDSRADIAFKYLLFYQKKKQHSESGDPMLLLKGLVFAGSGLTWNHSRLFGLTFAHIHSI